jgi:uncharacterized protein YndB with AHSA1/START domain
VATSHRTRVLAASQQELWEVIADAHHMPRWWPGVTRMEGVEADRFTQVFTTKRGRPVRVDFQVIHSEPPWARAWQQEIAGTPFERVLNESIIEVNLEPVEGGTEVTIGQQQKLRGYSRTGGFLLRRPTKSRLDEALDGLERLFASGSSAGSGSGSGGE